MRQPILTKPQRQRAWRLKKRGRSQREIAGGLACFADTKGESQSRERFGGT